jgi:hypothetical protein
MIDDQDEFDKPSEVTFLPSWIDFFGTVVLYMTVLIKSQAHQVQGQQLPQLRKDEKPIPQMVDPTTASNIELLCDGTLRLDGRTIGSQDLIQGLSAESGKRPILVCINIGPDGQGALEEFTQLQIDLAQAALWDRVRVRKQSTGSSNKSSRAKAGGER